MAAATGFYATAADVARFCSAHFMGDERLLSDATKRLLHHDEWSVDATPTSYGLGFAIAEVGGRRTLGHGGGYPGHITRTMFDPIDRLCVSVFTNAIDGPATAMATTIVRLIDLAAAAGMRPRATVDPSRFTGRFASMWGVLDIVSLDDRLYGLHPAYADPLAEHSCFDVVDDDTLRISATTGYGSFGELLRFARASDGSVSSLTSAGMTMLPEATLRERVGIRTSVRLGASLLT